MDFYISDTHFGHKNILMFDHRPYADLYQMEEVMVLRWNAAVRKNDTVYILGDFCFGKADEWLRILRKLNGTKVMIEGNHDLGHYTEDLRKEFIEIAPYKEIADYDKTGVARKVILSHYPMPLYKHSGSEKYYMLCGHVHNTVENTWLEKWTKDLRVTKRNDTGFSSVNYGQIYNVGCMMPWMGYTPRSLDEIIKRWDDYHKEEQYGLLPE